MHTDGTEDVLLQDLEGLPGDIVGGRPVHSHRYAGFENGDDDSDDDDDLGRAFEPVSTCAAKAGSHCSIHCHVLAVASQKKRFRQFLLPLLNAL